MKKNPLREEGKLHFLWSQLISSAFQWDKDWIFCFCGTKSLNKRMVGFQVSDTGDFRRFWFSLGFWTQTGFGFQDSDKLVFLDRIRFLRIRIGKGLAVFTGHLVFIWTIGFYLVFIAGW